MTHLTYEQIQEIVDGQNVDKDILRHMEECALCRREAALQRSVVSSLQNSPLVKASPGFTRSVMQKILPEEQSLWVFRILGGAGKVLAMAAVLAVIGYALTLMPASMGSAGESEISKTTLGFYKDVTQFLTVESGRMSSAITAQSSTEGSKVLTMTIVSLLALGLLDRFILRPFLKTRTRV